MLDTIDATVCFVSRRNLLLASKYCVKGAVTIIGVKLPLRSLEKRDWRKTKLCRLLQLWRRTPTAKFFCKAQFVVCTVALSLVVSKLRIGVRLHDYLCFSSLSQMSLANAHAKLEFCSQKEDAVSLLESSEP